MDARRWQTIERIFNAALALRESARDSFLDSECGGDRELRAEVESLLNETTRSDQFLSQSGFAMAADVLAHSEGKTFVGQTIGRYLIVRLLGRGGMGEVYLALDKSFGRRVAIKLLPDLLGQDEDAARRFKREVHSASAVSHPNVAHVYEVGEEDGRLFMAMEFIDGTTLRERLSGETIEVTTAIKIATQVCDALSAAHAQGVVHRDIKPENIMIRGDGIIKVVDFGLAKLTEPHKAFAKLQSRETQVAGRLTHTVHTQHGVLMGTVDYMSPEQLRCEDVDARTDIWSLGVVLFEMVACKIPFAGQSTSDTIAEILKAEPTFSTGQASVLVPTLKRVLQKSLNKNKTERYQTSDAMRSDLLIASDELDRNGIGRNWSSYLRSQSRKKIVRVAAMVTIVGILMTLVLMKSRWWPRAVAHNSSIDSGNGTLQNGASFAPGMVGQAFSFRAAANQGVTVDPLSPSQIPIDTLTIDAWVNPTSYANTFPNIVRRDGANAAHVYLLALTNAGQAAANILNIADPAGGSVPLNTWSHVALTYDRQNVKVYVNGIEVASAPFTEPLPPTSEDFTIGRADNRGDRGFDGLIDEVHLFSRALSASEIQSIYRAGSAGLCKGSSASVPTVANCIAPPSGLIGWWPGDGSADDLQAGSGSTQLR